MSELVGERVRIKKHIAFTVSHHSGELGMVTEVAEPGENPNVRVRLGSGRQVWFFEDELEVTDDTR